MAALGLNISLGIGPRRNGTVSNAIASTRGADTRSSAGAVNLGALLPETMVATSSTYTFVSGTSAHWNLPTNGTHPTPTAAGVTARLGGGPYVISYTISDGVRTVSDTLTITRDTAGRTMPAYSYKFGRTTVAAYTASTAVYTVATAAEASALTTAQLNGATVLIAKGAAPFFLFPAFGTAPTNAAIFANEDDAAPVALTGIRTNTSQRIYFLNPKVRTNTTLTAAAGSSTTSINLIGTAIKIYGMDYAAEGSDLSLRANFIAATCPQLHIINSRILDLYQCTIRSGADIVFARNVMDQFGMDTMILGATTTGAVLSNFVAEGNVFVRANIRVGDLLHPDGGQIVTIGTGTGLVCTDWHWVDNFSHAADGNASFNGAPFTGDGAFVPSFTGTNLFLGNSHVGVTAYGNSTFTNSTQTGATRMLVAADRSVRQLQGVTGTGAGGKWSGQQGFVTHSDDGTTYIPGNERQFPGFNNDFDATGKMEFGPSFFHGRQPAATGVLSFDAVFKGKASSSTPPDYTNPASIDDLSAYFDDPSRVVSYAGMTPAQIVALDREMFAAKAGGLLDRGDGRIDNDYCVRRLGAPAKKNQWGRINNPVLTYSAGSATVTHSDILDQAVIYDVFKNGTATGVVITIAAGATTASAAVTTTGGDVLLAKNDSGLLNPSVTV